MFNGWMLGLAIAAVAGALVLGMLWLFQRRLIYFPAGAVPPAVTVLAGSEEVVFDTDDGLRLGGWFVPTMGNQTGMTVLVFNGNAGNRSIRAPLAAALSQAGLAVLLFDYRGYGGNPGKPSEVGLLADARAARAYLVSRGDVDPARLVYLGESLGAAVAVVLATELPPVALILRSPFTSLVEVGRLHYPFLPVGLLLRDRYPATDQIRHVASPLLVVAGERDGIVPPAQSRKLYETAAGWKRFVLIPGAHHNDPELLMGDRFIREVVQFLRDGER
jgi:fermentation-respiration switch protein FrsA (DUF1100 family)